MKTESLDLSTYVMMGIALMVMVLGLGMYFLNKMTELKEVYGDLKKQKRRGTDKEADAVAFMARVVIEMASAEKLTSPVDRHYTVARNIYARDVGLLGVKPMHLDGLFSKVKAKVKAEWADMQPMDKEAVK